MVSGKKKGVMKREKQ